ncbi:MAG: hypothetical protein NWR63_06910, partial [OM182 bacterium]|nr:hypothetical protein [OM182 bacterium]
VYTHNQAMSFTRHGFFCGHWSKLFTQLRSLTLSSAAKQKRIHRTIKQTRLLEAATGYAVLTP